jgi:hypothetical protein
MFIFIFESCFPRFETSQEFVPWGLISRRTLLGGVSDPAELCAVGYQTHRINVCNKKMYITVPLFCEV